jgi:hypothetical protein
MDILKKIAETRILKLNVFKKIAQAKVFYSRSAIYISILNFLMILATFKASYNINISIFILIPMGVFLVLILGFLDYKLVMANEIMYSNQQNNIKSQLNIIEKKIDKLYLEENKK